MKTNRPVKTPAVTTHEGGRARVAPKIDELRRTVMASMLFEGSFYESGEDSADRVKRLIGELDGPSVAELVMEAREKMKLRHMPLYMLACMLAHKHHHKGLKELIGVVIKRADEMGELIALYKALGGKALPNQLKKGLKRAMRKFNAYKLTKYAGTGAWRVRDVMFMAHAKPSVEAHEAPMTAPAVQKGKYRRGCVLRHVSGSGLLYTQLANDVYEGAKTRESMLSKGVGALATYTELLVTRELGGMALLKNLKTMQSAGVDRDLIRKSIAQMDTRWVLPFRFLTAAKHAPDLSDVLERRLLQMLQEERTKLPGRTAILVDVSGSMDQPVSSYFDGTYPGYKRQVNSEVNRLEAAKALAILAREQCEEARVFIFANHIAVLPAHLRGFALADKIGAAHGGTRMGEAVRSVQSQDTWSRIIVITDEQTSDVVPAPQGKGYILNISTEKRGVGFGPWITVSGMSESLMEYIRQVEEG